MLIWAMIRKRIIHIIGSIRGEIAICIVHCGINAILTVNEKVFAVIVKNVFWAHSLHCLKNITMIAIYIVIYIKINSFNCGKILRAYYTNL